MEATDELNTSGYHKFLMDLTGLNTSGSHTIRTINVFDMVSSIKKVEKKNDLKIAVLSKGRGVDLKHFVKLAQTFGF